MNINRNQMLAIILVVLGVLTAGTAQLSDIFGPAVAKLIVSIAGLMMSMFSGVLAVLTGQSGIVKDALAMPGVENLTVNAQANPTLARIALDPAQPKISPTPEAVPAVVATSKQ